jgi:hypothetical protein
METSDWVTLGAALGGAVVGGIMALVGGLVVGRREQLRTTRVELLQTIDLLREHDWQYRGQIVPATLREVRQARVALSRRERRLLQGLLSLAAQPLPAPPRRDGRPSEHPGRDYEDTHEQVQRVLDDLERMVLRKLARVL